MAEDLLGGGLDIDGWSYLKQDAEHRSCADLTDKTYVLRQQYPRVLHSQLRQGERKEVHEIVIASIEHRAAFDTKWIGMEPTMHRATVEHMQGFIQEGPLALPR